MSAGVAILAVAGAAALWLLLGAISNVVAELGRIALALERAERRTFVAPDYPPPA